MRALLVRVAAFCLCINTSLLVLADEGVDKAESDYQYAMELLKSDDGLKQQAAVSWIRRAAHAGHPLAQFELGRAYGNAKGVPLDYELAVFWYRRAAHQGLAKAQYLMCLSHATGRGSLSDAIVAYAWCDLAADQGYQEAENTRDDIRSTLDTDAIERMYEWKTFLQRKIASSQ